MICGCTAALCSGALSLVRASGGFRPTAFDAKEDGNCRKQQETPRAFGLIRALRALQQDA